MLNVVTLSVVFFGEMLNVNMLSFEAPLRVVSQ
jgi:hypothetical protein